MYSKRFTYYGLIIASISMTLLIFLQIVDTDISNKMQSTSDWVLYYAKFFWFTGALVAIANFIGLAIYGIPDRTNELNLRKLAKRGWNNEKKLIVVYVSKGDNHLALERSIIATGRMLEKYKVNHRIDVVTDSVVENRHSHDIKVVYHVVPDKYTTYKGSRYKARALHYVVESHSREQIHDQDHQTWVLHLDEESQLHDTAVAGIHEFINKSENKNSIGQGEIKYNAHHYGKNWLIMAMDAIRSGDDLGRFRLQYTMFKKPLFGMHGSYVLLPGKLEQEYGFDLGGKGSITEDAYFALKCASDGYDFKWVDGYVREQSPHTLMAIIKQRRRWYCGLIYLSFDREIRFRNRIIMMLNMILWTVAWVGPIVTLINLIFGGYFPILLLIAAALIQGFYVSVYMIGLWRNLQDVHVSNITKVAMYVSTFVLIPVVNAIEGLAVIYGIVRPVRHFEVVDKN